MDTTLEDTSAWLKPETSQDLPRRCNAKTRAGKDCGGFATSGSETCVSHSPEGAAIRAKATQASAEARVRKAEGRKQATEDAKLTLTQWFARVAAENAEALARKAVERALDGNTTALTIVLERVEGKVTDHIAIDGNAPAEMAMDDLVAWLSTSVDSA